MKNNDIIQIQYWIHPEGFIYVGDQIEGARAATAEEVEKHNAQSQVFVAESEYSRATLQINKVNEKMEDNDYSEGETEESVTAIKKPWTEYRIALRAYIKAADGTKELPNAPDSN